MFYILTKLDVALFSNYLGYINDAAATSANNDNGNYNRSYDNDDDNNDITNI